MNNENEILQELREINRNTTFMTFILIGILVVSFLILLALATGVGALSL
jgi:predicted nucleic acid-binding Zn ribbon protein